MVCHVVVLFFPYTKSQRLPFVLSVKCLKKDNMDFIRYTASAAFSYEYLLSQSEGSSSAAFSHIDTVRRSC